MFVNCLFVRWTWEKQCKGKSEIQHDLIFLTGAIGKTERPTSWGGRASSEVVLGEGEELFSFGCLKFERPVRHWSEGTQWASAESREKSGLETSTQWPPLEIGSNAVKDGSGWRRAGLLGSSQGRSGPSVGSQASTRFLVCSFLRFPSVKWSVSLFDAGVFSG